MGNAIRWNESVSYFKKLKNLSKRKYNQFKIYNSITGRYLEKDFPNRYRAKKYIRELNLNQKVFVVHSFVV